ncbi:MAG TPA: AraC family transcriptional regulator [Bacteroidales bacterium]|nr:AraC family transcriptional regulator [Bacteroidales bacterium]
MEQVFSITKLDIGEVKGLSEAYSEPHIHDYEELIIGISGEIEHFIDFRAKTLTAPFISFVTQGKPHVVRTSAMQGRFEGWLITFRSEFIAETTFQLYSQFHDKANILFNPGECFHRMPVLCSMMNDEMTQAFPDYGVIRQLLTSLFTIIESERKKSAGEEAGSENSRNAVFSSFLEILEDNFRRPAGVDFYAGKLFMTPRNLNLICRSVFQKSITEIIETRKLIEAKNLLINTGKSISEIGFELGFSEKAYFTNVFKKRTGQTPGEFRKEMRKMIS